MKKEGLIVFIILIGIMSFHIVNNYIISSIDLAPLFYDNGDNIRASFKIYSLLQEHKFFDALWANLGDQTSLFYIVSFPFYVFFGLNQKSAVMTNFIFLAILIFSVYGIGKLLHSRGAGVLAAYIVTIFPGIFSLSRIYFFDFALTAMVAFSIYCLLKTNKFMNRKFSVLLGLAIGLSMVIKPPFIIFFLAPFCYYLFFSSRNVDKQILFQKLKNFIIFLISSILSVLFFYVPVFSEKIEHYLRVIPSSGRFTNLSYFSSENVLFYLKGLFGIQALYFFSVLFFIFSIIIFLKNNRKTKIFLFLWFLIPYLFFTFYVLNNKELRFIAPYLPAVALIISISLFEIRKSIIRWTLLFLAIFVGLFQFFLVSYFPSNSYFIDSLNENFFDLHSFFTAPAYDNSLIGRPHAYKTDYGLNHVAESFKDLERPIRQDQIAFVDAAGQITRPIQYLIPQNDISLLKKELWYNDIINDPSQVETNRENRTLRFTKPPKNIDFVILSSNSYKFININEFMKLVKTIDLENNESLYIFENF